VKDVIEKNPNPVEDYKSGKQNALQYLVGQVMKETKGKVNPQKAMEILKKYLK
jgi:aspartyl-tRNA(Asn)/glutamyl-tRNA(Gln) amidotransferase subunit B